MWSQRTLLLLGAGATLWSRCAAQDVCYTTGGVAGIVFATIVVTIVVGGLTAAVAVHLWKRRAGSLKGGEKVTPAETGFPEKQLIGPKDDYAFDNPYFKDDDGDHGGTPDAAEKGEAGFPSDRGDTDNSQNSKGSKQKKHRPFTSLPFHSVFNHGGRNKKSMDDSFLSKQSKRSSVRLRGHDFTGLGFSICGSMRDGIFVKDVLHRGPASESGKIKAGDRIIGVTVSFGAMVYEDALTILSYASPYDVRLELEEGPEKNGLLATSSPGKRLASASFRNGGQQLFHPLYRSQSIDDLTQIGKETFTLSTKLSNSVVSYQRSQSNQQTASNIRPQLKTSESAPDTKALYDTRDNRKSVTADSSPSRKTSNGATGSNRSKDRNEKGFLPLLKTSVLNKKEAPKVEPHHSASEMNGKLIYEKHETEIPTMKEKNCCNPGPPELAGERSNHLELDSTKVENPQTVVKTPTAPPRKPNTPSKRRAPAPPRSEQTSNKTSETSALIHRVDDSTKSNDDFQLETSTIVEKGHAHSSDQRNAENHSSRAEDTIDSKSILVLQQDKKYEVEDDSTSISDNSLNANNETEESTNPKRKATSLGDLTKLDEGTNRKTSSSILERAVSLDLQQQQCLPEGNLGRQKKTLKPPAFNPDDTSEEDFQNVQHKGDSLRHWELIDSWDRLPTVSDNSDASPSASVIISSNLQKQILPHGERNYMDVSNGHQELAEEHSNSVTADGKECLSEQTTEGNILSEVDSVLSSQLTPMKKGQINITSTPAHNSEFIAFTQESSPVNKIVSLTANRETAPEANPAVICDETSSTWPETLFSPSVSGNSQVANPPVSINIPIIPPVIGHYEKLWFSPGLYTMKDSSDGYRSSSSDALPPLCKPTFLQEQRKTSGAMYVVPSSLDVESATSIEDSATTQDISKDTNDKSVTITVDSINGKDIDAAALEYRTAVEYPTASGSRVFTTSKVITNSLPSNSPTGLVSKNSTVTSEIIIHGSDTNFPRNMVISPPGEEVTHISTRPKSPPVQLDTSQEATMAFF